MFDSDFPEGARMRNVKISYVPCTIKAGGFSSERVFKIDDEKGGQLIGVANVEYVVDENHNRIGKDVPGYGESIPGFVQCRLIQEQGNRVLIELPSADVVYVPKDELVPLST